MDNIKSILVVTRSTKYCQKAVHYGVSLARKYGAQLSVLHVIHNPFGLKGWPIAIPSLKNLEEEYKEIQRKAKSNLDRMIELEKSKGLSIDILIRDGDPKGEIFRVVEERKIDLLIMLAHEEGRIEHFLFGHGNEEIIRKMPCSIMLIKKEPGPVPY